MKTLILFLACACALAAAPLPREKPVLIVGTSHSMTMGTKPAMSVGDICIVDTAFPFEKLKVNDIAWIDGRVFHRLSSRFGPLFYTKGDANWDRDPSPLGTSNYYGKVTQVIHKDGSVDRY